MTFELRPGRYVSRIFYVELAVTVPGNMMGWIFRDGPEGEPWLFEYRMRYYADDDLTHKSQDRKSWYRATCQPGATLETLLPGTRVIFEMAGRGKYEEIIVESDDPKVVSRRLFEQPWCHHETLTQEEFDARNREKQ